MLDLDVCREDENAGLRKLVADGVRRLEPLRGVCRGHPDVHDRQFRLVLAYELDQLVRVPRLADYLEVRSLEQARDSFAQKDVIVGDDDAPPSGRLGSHDRPNLTPVPASRYGKIPALRMRRGALVGYRRGRR
jgi:hypothetical protein